MKNQYPQPVLSSVPHLDLLKTHARRFGIVDLRTLPGESDLALAGTDLGVERMRAQGLLDMRWVDEDR